MFDYSQGKEQEVILEYFKGRTGTFVDLGANDGLTLSNTRALLESGWQGVLVEPIPAAFEKLIQNADYFIKNGKAKAMQVAIAPKDGPIELHESGTHLRKGDVGLLSTLVPSEMDRWKRSGEEFSSVTVPGMTVKSFIREIALPQINFFSIDCEGMDLDILTQLDLRAHDCEMLCIEYNNNKVAESIMSVYCANHGLRLIKRNFENLIFAR